MIIGKATEAAELEMLLRSEQEWVDHWICKRCTMDRGWADTWVVPIATSRLLQRSILMLGADYGRKGSASTLSSPDGVLRTVTWGVVNDLFPPGSIARSRLLVITYNGNMRSVGNHFNSTVPRMGLGGESGRRIMDKLLCFEWSVMRGVSWAAAAIERFAAKIEANTIVYPCRADLDGPNIGTQAQL